jgi:hypothetical protein
MKGGFGEDSNGVPSDGRERLSDWAKDFKVTAIIHINEHLSMEIKIIVY